MRDYIRIFYALFRKLGFSYLKWRTPQNPRLAGEGFKHASGGAAPVWKSLIAAPGITKHGSPASERAVRDSLAGLMPARSDSTHLKSSVERWISPFLRQVCRTSDSIGSLYALPYRSSPSRRMSGCLQPTEDSTAGFLDR